MPKAQVTEATIARTLRAARKAGETVYGYSVEGNIITVHTRPVAGVKTEKDDLEKWLADDDD